MKKNPWDLDASFDDKAYRYGINRTDKGVELCWGISACGINDHEISYKINPIIIGLNDHDILFWQFINKDMLPPPRTASIAIKAYKPFDDEIRMWGFGMEGEIHNERGAIVMTSSGPVKYGTVMLRFPKGYFNTSYHIDKSFDDYADQAIVGSKWEDSQGQVTKDSTFGSKNSTVTFTILAFVAMIFLFMIIVVFVTYKMAKNLQKGLAANLDRKNILPKTKDLDGK